MAITTTAELLSALDSWLVRDDLIVRFPYFIMLAEAKFNRTLFHPRMETRTTLTVDTLLTDPEFLDLPSDFQTMRSVRLSGVAGKPRLNFLTQTQMDDRYSIAMWRYFSIVGDQIELGDPERRLQQPISRVIQPTVADYEGQATKNILNVIQASQATKNILNVLPRAMATGRFPRSRLPRKPCSRPVAAGSMHLKSDGSVQVFAGTSLGLYQLNNTDLSWKPVSRPAAVTSISNANPGVVTYANTFVANQPVVFGGTVLPSQLVALARFIMSAQPGFPARSSVCRPLPAGLGSTRRAAAGRVRQR
jgi:hypothetical protein